MRFVVVAEGGGAREPDAVHRPPLAELDRDRPAAGAGRELELEARGQMPAGMRADRLSTYDVRTPGGAAPRVLFGAAPTPLPESHEAQLSAGFITGPHRWLGLHSTSELERDSKPGQLVRRVVRQLDGSALRQLVAGTHDPESGEGYHRIIAMEPLSGATYAKRAFLRMDGRFEPIRLGEPDSALIVFSSAAGQKAILTVARVDAAGSLLWKIDTGIDRFALRQILPGARSVAFVGPTPPVPDRVPEPLLVLVASETGAAGTHPLWR